jgi:PAS domain S-box-containing protein
MDDSLEARLKSTLNMIPAYTWYAAPPGALTFVNERCADYLGLPRDHPLRLGTETGAAWDSHIALLHPDDRDEMRRVWSTCLRTGSAGDVSFRLRNAQGGYRWFVNRAEPLRANDGTLLYWIGINLDIEERKQAEFYLAEGQRLTHTGCWAFNAAGFEYWSSELFRIHGLEPSGKAPSIPEYMALVHPEDREFVAQEIQKMLADNRGFDFTKRIVRPDGAIRRVRCVGSPATNGGIFQGFVGTGIDVTEQEQLAQALRKSEEELRRREAYLAEAQRLSHTGSFGWKPDTGEIIWSAETYRIFEYDRAVTPTMDLVAQRVHPEDRADFQSVIERASGGAPDLEHAYRLLLPDGRAKHVHALAHATQDASGNREFVGAVTDMTDHKRAEESLRASEGYLAEAQRLSQTGSWAWAPDRGIRYWSEECYRVFSFDPRDGLPRFEDFFQRLHPDDQPGFRELIQTIIREKAEFEADYRIVHPDGPVRDIHVVGHPVLSTSGHLVEFVGTVIDITERKRAEEELRRAQRLEAIGTLAGGIAHDFNNILGAILGYGEMAMRDAKTGTRLRRDLDSIMAAGERGRALVDRILAFSRSGVGERVPVHVEEVVREALDQIAASLPENVTITPRLRAGRAAMLGDSTQVHQVAMNLANNAVHAMPQGGVLRVSLDTLRIEAPRATLIGSVSPGEHIVLEMTDSGTGIRPDVLERMFDPFFTTKEVGVGSGLGLSLVHGIVATVGGAIDVATELGKGSTFTVYLPQSGDAPAKAADENRPLPRGEGERVLVVDDEEPLVRLAAETLQSLGYAPVGFTSSANALQAFGANPGRFDAILTDERMPGVTGSTIIREVRRINPSIPILLMSGFVSGAAALKARELGANGVLKKPLLASELATSLARVLHP